MCVVANSSNKKIKFKKNTFFKKFYILFLNKRYLTLKIDILTKFICINNLGSYLFYLVIFKVINFVMMHQCIVEKHYPHACNTGVSFGQGYEASLFSRPWTL